MKKIAIASLGLCLAAATSMLLMTNRADVAEKLKKNKLIPAERSKVPKSLLMAMQTERHFMLLRDPHTGSIPLGIRAGELGYVSALSNAQNGGGQDWTWRGPANIGGRMLCIAVDIDNENHLLSGSASGGMWESENQGLSWHKTTAPDAEQSATCLTQDKRPGKHNIWFYGTGELLSTTGRNISTNARTIGIGNGIFKSTDNGATWQPLASTQGGTPAVLTEVFQGVWRIVTDPVRMDKDIVYAACYGAITRSEDGGATWEVVLGDLENKSFATDIAVTSGGVLYAALSSYCMAVEPPGKAGIWRSTDGKNWKRITPPGFPTDNRVTRLAIAPSNENIMYVFTESQSPILDPFNGYPNTINTFWKMTWESAADTSLWENRTHGIPGGGNGDIDAFPYSLVVYGGYCFTMGVKPDDENIVFLGGMNFHRSTNGFADSLQTTYVGGYPYDMDSLNQLHPDQHGVTFLPSDPNTMFMSNDGGVYITHNCMADSSHMTWKRLNHKLTTTQFYSVAIDHGGSGDDWILGGLQDNNWYYTVTDNPAEFWFNIDICYDGFASFLAPGWEYCVISAYSGNIWTSRFDENMHTTDIFPQLPDTLLDYYDPGMGSNSLFPFYQNIALDPNNYETFYLPTVTSIWRKDNLKAAAHDSSLRNAGWNHLSNVDVGNAAEISYLTVSRTPADRLYYGTNLGKLYRLDNARTGNPVPIEITGSEFPYMAFVASIDINSDNADEVMVVFSNYGVESLFYTNDGGTTWEAVAGNLEEHPDGTGHGPSVRCSKMLNYQGKKVYFAGTSCGLFSATELKGDSTIWVKEGAGTIGNVIVDMIDARETDGFIAVGTHGNGVYSTYYNPSAGLQESSGEAPAIGNPFPNPAGNAVEVAVTSGAAGTLGISIMNGEGRLVKTIPARDLRPGIQNLRFGLEGLPAGIYYLLFSNGTTETVRKIIRID